MSGAVQAFSQGLLALRRAGRLKGRTVTSQSRMLYTAVWRDVEDRPGYDPAEDARVRWAHAVLYAAREGCARPLADSDTEAAVEVLLEGWEKFSKTGDGI
jgi:hypothetical protein